ncbi:MAG: Diguanylate cyclase/phosphodiesterase with PAS/PAC and GAF sensor(S) [uncultured bacterium]|nr:MAG: Diguanylate cyclase/phosphodiesterase with PAS/PAC and GAF sensor(S) [uncultured bacterium]
MKNVLKCKIARELLQEKSNISNQQNKSSSWIIDQKEYIKKIIDAIPYPFYVIDLNYVISLANATAKKMKILEGQLCYQATHKSDKPCSGEHGCPLRAVSVSKMSVCVEHVHYELNGKKRFVEVYGAPILNDRGEVVQLIESSIDITERKETEAAVQTIFRSISETIGQDFFNQVTRNLCEWLGADLVLAAKLINKKHVQVLSMISKGQVLDNYKFAYADTPFEHTLKNNYSYYKEGLSKEFPKAKIFQNNKYAGYLGVAILDKQGKPIGVMCAFSSRSFILPQQAKEVMQILAVRASSEIQRKHYEDKLNELSITDDLTGLRNRRGFFMLAEHQLKVAKRSKVTTAIFFIDLDNMKKINDENGHLEGDKALITVAEILKKIFRESDIIARIGGDEFAVFAMNVSKTNAEMLRKRIHATLKACDMKKRSSVKISVSIGISFYNALAKCGLIGTLLTKADRAMYAQKRKLKNL